MSGSEVHWAHIQPRRHKAIRWAEENSLCLCPPCHRWFDTDITAGRVWLIQHYPERVQWLAEVVDGDGIPRSQKLFTSSDADILELEQQLKARLKELKQ